MQEGIKQLFQGTTPKLPVVRIDPNQAAGFVIAPQHPGRRPSIDINIILFLADINPLETIAKATDNGGRCTWFLTGANPVTARKKWIAGSLEPRGTLTVDAGAVAALRRGKSLLPAGVVRVDGAFNRGDAVVVRGPDGAEIGRGLIAYDADDAVKIRGKSSGDILLILGFAGRAEMIHRDDLVLGSA